VSPGIVVDNTVLDCTSYVLRHPGGQQIIHGFGGQDASWQWFTFHDRKTWNDIASTLRVGRTEGVENRHVKPKAFVGLRGFGYQDD
jgi:cytochrome b involved in lipid metabolism